MEGESQQWQAKCFCRIMFKGATLYSEQPAGKKTHLFMLWQLPGKQLHQGSGQGRDMEPCMLVHLSAYLVGCRGGSNSSSSISHSWRMEQVELLSLLLASRKPNGWWGEKGGGHIYATRPIGIFAGWPWEQVLLAGIQIVAAHGTSKVRKYGFIQ